MVKEGRSLSKELVRDEWYHDEFTVENFIEGDVNHDSPGKNTRLSLDMYGDNVVTKITMPS